MCEDILRTRTPIKVVALPIRTISRGVPFYNAVVIRDTRIVGPRAPDANPRGTPQIACHIYPQLSFQFTARSPEAREYRGRAAAEKPSPETNPCRRTALYSPSRLEDRSV